MPPTFPTKKFRTSTNQNAIAAWYRRQLVHHPFALFGLPFIVTMVAGSFFLTPATAIRYERHDRKVQQLTKEEALGLGKNRRRIDINEEYYRLAAKTKKAISLKASACEGGGMELDQPGKVQLGALAATNDGEEGAGGEHNATLLDMRTAVKYVLIKKYIVTRRHVETKMTAISEREEIRYLRLIAKVRTSKSQEALASSTKLSKLADS